MSGEVIIAADLESLALVVRVDPGASEAGVRAAVDASAAQRPSAVVLDLKPMAATPQPGPVRLLRDGGLLGELSRVCARYAVPLVIVPVLAATVALTSPRSGEAPAAYPDVSNALAALPRLGSADSRTLTLAGIDTAPARARDVVAQELAAWHLDELLFPAQLVASELVSNAVLHAAPPVGLLVRRVEDGGDRGILLGVHDRSGRPPRPAEHDPADVGRLHGRGLAIVPAVAARWGCLLGTGDKVVWAEVISPAAATS